MDMKALEAIGLTKSEANVYLAVLELGSCLAGEITKKTGMHRRSIYDAIERLIQKGLVSYIKTNNRKYFEAADPNVIMSMAKEQEENILLLLPELLLKYNIQKNKQETTFFSGVAGIKSIFEDEIKEKKEIMVFGASTDIQQVMRWYLPHYEKARVQHKIPVKIIYDESAKGDELTKNAKYLQIRYLPKQYRSPSSTNVYGDKVAIFLWGDEPLAILIHNKKIAESYKKFFKLMWNSADK